MEILLRETTKSSKMEESGEISMDVRVREVAKSGGEGRGGIIRVVKSMWSFQFL